MTHSTPMQTYDICDIEYDEGHEGLPTHLQMTSTFPLSDAEMQQQASDFISAQTGFCHLSFSVTPGQNVFPA